MADASAETTAPRYSIAVGPTGLHRIVARDGRPLGTPRPAGAARCLEGPTVAGLLIALRWQQAIRCAHAVLQAAPAAPPNAAGPALVPVTLRRGRPPGWRPADRGAFARRLRIHGQDVRDARRRSGLSQRGLARALRLERSVVAAAEAGERNVGPVLARWAAQALGRRASGRAAARTRIRPPLRLSDLTDAQGRPFDAPPAVVRRLGVLNRVRTGSWTQAAAGAALGISARQVRRLLATASVDGPAALLHGLRGRSPANRLPAVVRERVRELARTRYAGCSTVRLSTVLAERHGIAVSRETLRTWLRLPPAGPPATVLSAP